jgi:GalNAc-alpha-(1->4)-GalNAc-alpha-(1->3)-diNAcBac-PP-undecaprenol alpha-1,4-N-acetyl-D-galactosaminyltransferase
MKITSLKITVVLPHLTCGGTERAASELANYIAASGGDITLLLMYHKQKFYEINPKVKLIEPEVVSNKSYKAFYLLYMIYFMRKHLKKLNPDIVFAMGYIAFTLFASLGLSTRVIMSWRSNPKRIRFPDSQVLNLLYKITHWLLRRRVDGIIAQTTYAADFYKMRYRCPIVMIPNFLRPIKEYHHERKDQIINVGHCSFEKGQHYLIRAFAQLNASTWKLFIVGDGPRKKELEDLANELEIGERVVFMGYKKDVDFYLSSSKIFAFTSVIEGYPNALIEAMATPLPVVSFACESGPSDIIKEGENGFLVTVGDVVTFANRLQMLIGNPELRENIQRKALEIRISNDLSMIVQKYIEFFEKIAAYN